MAAYGLWQVDGSARQALRKAKALPRNPDSHAAMVMPWPCGVYAERNRRPRHPAFPQQAFPDTGKARLPRPISELGNHLRPDRNHADKQGNRRQRRCFFHEQPQHEPDSDVRTYEEHCSFFVPGVKGANHGTRDDNFRWLIGPPWPNKKAPGIARGFLSRSCAEAREIST